MAASLPVSIFRSGAPSCAMYTSFSRRQMETSLPCGSIVKPPPSMGQASSRQDSTPIFLAALKLAPPSRECATYMSRLPSSALRHITWISPLLSTIAVGWQHWQIVPDGDSYTSPFLDQVV